MAAVLQVPARSVAPAASACAHAHPDRFPRPRCFRRKRAALAIARDRPLRDRAPRCAERAAHRFAPATRMRRMQGLRIAWSCALSLSPRPRHRDADTTPRLDVALQRVIEERDAIGEELA